MLHHVYTLPVTRILDGFTPLPVDDDYAFRGVKDGINCPCNLMVVHADLAANIDPIRVIGCELEEVIPLRAWLLGECSV
jgi:hypothetical protein